ncbi:FAD-dependent oxidoreductase [Palleronia sp. LCG004]|uniref:NAD(P)/FAD-dependent oxidoreductase n=1 Tax=Palleronia sp. LCG004 TaxID=3079304 RepID=UPI0029428304|nr:FAD-dependent oxidoreductase [Palleronia sp. LCG004]WOI58245.1 FAD-dependent oxidoreductase [Palleronia sp. LCG004]
MSAHVIVIGGGLVGSAVAFGLLGEGQDVTILDEGDIALRASRGNFGLVWVQSKGDGMPEYAQWTRRSADLWSGFAEELADESGVETGYAKPGGMHLLLSEEALEARRDLNNRMHNVNGAAGYGAEILDRKALLEVLPGIGPDVVGGSYSPHDGHTNPLRTLRGLHGAIARRGGRYISGAGAQSITRDGEGYAVETPKGTFRGDRVVLAAGHGNKWLGPDVGLDIPLRPQKGQILVSERTAPFLPMPTHVVRQTDEGSVMFGDSHEDTGYGDTSSTDVIRDLSANAIRCFPHLASLRIVRSWGAVRVLSTDGFPIYQESESHPGVFSVNCHSGVTLAAAHALELAPMIAAGALSPELGVFSAKRFSHD